MEPAFAPRGPVWPLGAMALTALEPDDPDCAIPRGAPQADTRYETPEPIRILDPSARLSGAPVEPLRVTTRGTAERKRKWTLALVASCVFHAATALFLIGASDEQALLEGAELSGIAFLGSAPEDQVSAGDPAKLEHAVAVSMITMLEAETVEVQTVPATETAEPVETVEAEPLQTETLQPLAEQTSERASPDRPLQPISAERAEPAPPAAAEPPSPAVEAPRILATDTLQPVEDEHTAPESAETTQATIPDSARTSSVEQVERAETVETAALEPAASEIIDPEPDIPFERIPLPTPRPAEQPTQVEQVAPKPKSAKVARAAKPAKKAAAKPASKARKSGSGGENQADARRGQSDGQADGRTAATSAGRKNSAAGNAAVSNYPGKVVSRLRRALRYPAEARRQRMRGEAHVQFTISAGGGVGSVRVVKSSGFPVLDQAALETVRRAAPFPAIPSEAGRSTWPFTVPLAFTR